LIAQLKEKYYYFWAFHGAINMEKNILITGSTSGIGLGIAIEFAKSGWNIAINGFGEDKQIKDIIEQISNFGVKAIYYSADVGNYEQVKNMIKDINLELGNISAVINNAGIQHVESVENFPLDKWDAIMHTNLYSAFYTTNLVIKQMYEQKFGRIINIASAHGLVASAKKSAYVAAKHGVIGLTKAVALEAAGTGVTCNAICPGWVLTPLVEKQIAVIGKREKISHDDAKLMLLSEKQPSKQFVTVEQVGKLALFLASKDADNITGSSYSIDGGWTAQ
jgi:3-hydroxybutyrate dehydrogenase